MPPKKLKSQPKKHPKTVTIGEKTYKLKFGKVPLTVNTPIEHVIAAEKMRRDEGADTVQDIMRIGFTGLLKKGGYI